MFLDFLQIRGEARQCLDTMFDNNVFEIRKNKTEETKEKIKFSLKKD